MRAFLKYAVLAVIIGLSLYFFWPQEAPDEAVLAVAAEGPAAVTTLEGFVQDMPAEGFRIDDAILRFEVMPPDPDAADGRLLRFLVSKEDSPAYMAETLAGVILAPPEEAAPAVAQAELAELEAEPAPAAATDAPLPLRVELHGEHLAETARQLAALLEAEGAQVGAWSAATGLAFPAVEGVELEPLTFEATSEADVPAIEAATKQALEESIAQALEVRQESEERAQLEKPYVIRFAPGMAYFPDMVPFGIGEPLDGLNIVARRFERAFPDTLIEYVNVPVLRREYLVTQLGSGKAPDIINVNVEDVWVDVQKGWYVPLDPWLEKPIMPEIQALAREPIPEHDEWWDLFKYQAVSRGKAAPDGLNYCLTYDLVETAIFYNKDIFREVGIKPPETWEELIENLKKLKAAEYIPLIIHLDWLSDWTVDLFFDQLYYDLLPGIDLVQDPVREQYLEGYLDWDELSYLYEKGFFGELDARYRQIWEIMYEMRQYCNENLGSAVGTLDPVREFVTQKGAMLWNTSNLSYRLNADNELGFEWGVFYLPPFTKQTSQYASLVDMCVIGGSSTQIEVTNSAFRDTGNPETSTRLKRVMQFLQFLTLPENHRLVVNEYACFLPNIVGVDALPILQPFVEILERRYTTTKWLFTFDLKFSEIQRRMLNLYLNDGIDLDEFMEWQQGNLTAATTNLMQRKEIDLERLRKKWIELAPVRAEYEDLPPEVAAETQAIVEGEAPAGLVEVDQNG